MTEFCKKELGKQRRRGRDLASRLARNDNARDEIFGKVCELHLGGFIAFAEKILGEKLNNNIDREALMNSLKSLSCQQRQP